MYIAQRYLNKIFTQRELEVFAYLYDGLHMSAELLEYVVEHCVQGGHTSIRYIETVAISWHEKGLRYGGAGQGLCQRLYQKLVFRHAGLWSDRKKSRARRSGR